MFYKKHGSSLIEIEVSVLIFSLIMVINAQLLGITSESMSLQKVYLQLINYNSDVRKQIEYFNSRSPAYDNQDVIDSLKSIAYSDLIKTIDYEISPLLNSDLAIVEQEIELSNGTSFTSIQYLY